MKITRRRFLAVLGSAAATCAGAGAYARWIEPTWLKTYEVEITVPRLDPAFDGYVITQLSDLHVGGGVPTSLLEEAVARCLDAKPDLAVLTGDFIQDRRPERSTGTVEEVLGSLTARDGVLAVLGNHDAGVFSSDHTPDVRKMNLVTKALESAGARVLENAERILTRGSARLRVIGLGDLWTRRFRPDPLARRHPDMPTIALSHNPDTAPELSRLGCDVILSGHTHGGQVRIPFFTPPRLPVRRHDLAAGLVHLPADEGGAQVYVNRGVGWLRQVRFCVRPEVTVIRLRTATGATG
jgi:uncharacterized protein